MNNFSKDEVSAEAFKSLYGTTRKNDVDLAKESIKDKIIMPTFEEIIHYVASEAQSTMKAKTKCFSVGNHMLPFSVKTYTEVKLVGILK